MSPRRGLHSNKTRLEAESYFDNNQCQMMSPIQRRASLFNVVVKPNGQLGLTEEATRHRHNKYNGTDGINGKKNPFIIIVYHTSEKELIFSKRTSDAVSTNEQPGRINVEGSYARSSTKSTAAAPTI